MPQRIQKLLAQMGCGSRREIETWIRAGRIQVNGRPAKIGERIDADDRISLDKKPVHLNNGSKVKNRILAYYKPGGLICTSRDPEGRETVFEHLPALKKQRWISVGRLDINTSGLMLFSNNGDWAHYLMHPSSNIEREYAVRVLGEVGEKHLSNLRAGIMLDGRLTRCTDIVDSEGKAANRWFHMTITEGRNREVRRMWQSQGFKVSRLIRVRYGSYILPRNKKPGDYWDLTDKEIDQLTAFVKASV